MKRLIKVTYNVFYQKKTHSFKEKVYAVLTLVFITFFSLFAFAEVM